MWSVLTSVPEGKCSEFCIVFILFEPYSNIEYYSLLGMGNGSSAGAFYHWEHFNIGGPPLSSTYWWWLLGQTKYEIKGSHPQQCNDRKVMNNDSWMFSLSWDDPHPMTYRVNQNEYKQTVPPHSLINIYILDAAYFLISHF